MRRERTAKLGKKRRRGQLITVGILVAIAIGVGSAVYYYVQNPPPTVGFGGVGSAHEHAALKLFINDLEPIDFSLPAYQVKDRYIHFEDNNGVIAHRHATGVHLGYLFYTLGMSIDDSCIKLANGTSYCNDGKTLKAYVNSSEETSGFSKYVLKDGDRILITYGNETKEEIQNQLRTLDLIDIPTGQP